MAGADVGVEVREEEVVEAEEEVKEEVQEMGIEEVRTRTVPHEAAVQEVVAVIMVVGKASHTHVTTPNVMQTSLHLSPAGATGPMGSLRTFVWSRPHAPGRSSGSLNQIIEGQTSSRKTRILIQFKICYTLLIFRK